MNFTIREATEQDFDVLWGMQLEMFDTQGHSDDHEMTREKFRQIAFEKNPVAHFLILEILSSGPKELSSAPKIVAFASYCYVFSSHIGKGMFVEDIYIRKEYRRCGYGVAFMQALCKVALENDCVQVKTECHEWNTPGRRYHDAVNLICSPTMNVFRMSSDVMESHAKMFMKS